MMSIAVYARMTKLTDVGGRIDYISNPKRQENLLATATTVEEPLFWNQLAADSQAAFRAAGGARQRKNKKGEMVEIEACEARELVGDLPMSAMDLDLNELAGRMAKEFKARYGVDCSIAIHLNKSRTNLHYHLIFAERQRMPEPEIRIADRNTFVDEKGVRRRTKKEILDPEGQLRPGCKIIPKGEVLSERYFGEKDPVFQERGWLYDYKQYMATWINDTLRPDVRREVFDRNSPYLAQFHLGGLDKADKPELQEKAARIREYNSAVKIFNARVRSGKIPVEEAHRMKTVIMLAPDRLPALRAAVLMQDGRAGYIPATMAEQGGRRTKDTANAEKKQELRDLYRLAAIERQAAKTSVSLGDRMYHTEAARRYSARIDRLRIELGYFNDEDYVRRLKRIDDDIRRRRDWVLRCKSRSSFYSHRIDSINWRIKKLEKELFDMPIIFLSKADKARKAQIEREIDELKIAKGEAWENYFEARRQEKEARQLYKAEKAMSKARKRELKAARRKQITTGKAAEKEHFCL